MKKHETLNHWQSLPANQTMLDKMLAIPYKAKGSTYGTCGIRIDGTPEFIDAVLSNLKELLGGENNCYRLGLARNSVDGSKLGKEFENREDSAECCYIRLHERGRESQAFNAAYGLLGGVK
jgi:hypothetical protein